jgi:hypothetical protein
MLVLYRLINSCCPIDEKRRGKGNSERKQYASLHWEEINLKKKMNEVFLFFSIKNDDRLFLVCRTLSSPFRIKIGLSY